MPSIQLPAKLDAVYDRLSQHTRRSKEFLVKEALEQYLEELHDIFELSGIKTRKNDRYISSEEVRKELKGFWKKKDVSRRLDS